MELPRFSGSFLSGPSEAVSVSQFPEYDVRTEVARQTSRFAVLTAIAASLGGAIAAILIAIE